jgi:hypothetical protein
LNPMHSSTRANELKGELSAFRDDISVFLNDFESRLDIGQDQIGSWKSSLDQAGQELAEETFRAAVIGSVKAGKSTFINYLLGRDLLKRGAGIITSIVTRVMGGPDLAATLTLKGMQQINAEISNSLLYFQRSDLLEGSGFDMRDAKNRQRLSELLKELADHTDSTQEAATKNRMLLQAFSSGYDELADSLMDQESTMVLRSEEALRHRDFVGDERLAVYLKELVLTVPEANLPAGVEIGDCQGSDSPNPNHMAAVLDYLLQSHLSIYLISVRTGVREADVKLINALKKLRMEDRTLFVLNLDLGELDSLAQLEQQVASAHDSLGQLGLSPRLYAFSSLYHLLRRLKSESGGKLDERDRMRLDFWESAKDLLEYSDQKRELFQTELSRVLSYERDSLKLERGVNQLGRAVKNMDDYIAVRLFANSGGSEEVKKACNELQERQDELRNTLGLVQNSLKSVADSLKRELKADVDEFFDRNGAVVGNLLDFIEQFSNGKNQVSDEQGQEHVMGRILDFYEELSDKLTRYINEEVNLHIIEYVRQKEADIVKRFEGQTHLYLNMMRQLFEKYYAEVGQMVEGLAPRVEEEFALSGKRPDLKLPLFSVTVSYQNKTRAQILLLVGLQRAMAGARNLARKVLKKKEGGTGAVESFEKGMAVIKKSALQVVNEQIRDYKENLKYGYILRLVDLIGENLYQQMHQYVGGSLVDLQDLLHLAEAEEQKKDETSELLAEYKKTTQAFLDTIARIDSARADL